MNKAIQNIKGMVDILPQQSQIWQSMEAIFADLLSSYGYQQIRTPIVEQTDLFKRSIGEVTDVVEKEMYTFKDRNDSSLTLRPEGTASCVRACQQHALLDNQQQQRLWYQGPMFRYEKPQKGRQRQFHQMGVENFNMTGAEADAEVILICHDLWQRLGLADNIKLELNTIGSLADRQAFKAALVDYLDQYRNDLDADSQRRLTTNPLRILDSKDTKTQSILATAPCLHDFLGEKAQSHFTQLQRLLETAGIQYTINPRLVRGLDYYNDTVFEWVTTDIGAQGSVCGGGRYDGMVEQLGGKPVPAVGFAIGLERLTLLLEEVGKWQKDDSKADIYFVIACDETDYSSAFAIAKMIRDNQPRLRLITHCGGGSFKSQMKKADKSGATYALIAGSNELESGVIALKPLRNDAEQETIRVEDLCQRIGQLF